MLMGACVTSARNSVLRLNIAWECVSSSPTPAAHSSGRRSPRDAAASRPLRTIHFEDGEGHDEQHDERRAVLQDIGQAQALQKPARGPAASPRIVAEKQEGGQAEQTSTASGGPPARRGARGRRAVPIENEEAGPVMVASDHARSTGSTPGDRTHQGLGAGDELVHRRRW